MKETELLVSHCTGKVIFTIPSNQYYEQTERIREMICQSNDRVPLAKISLTVTTRYGSNLYDYVITLMKHGDHYRGAYTMHGKDKSSENVIESISVNRLDKVIVITCNFIEDGIVYTMVVNAEVYKEEVVDLEGL